MAITANETTAVTRRTAAADLPEYLRVDEMAAWLDIGRSLAFEMVRRGDVPSMRCGRLIRVPRSALIAMTTDAR